MVEKYGWDQTPTPDLGLDITKAPEDIQKLYKWVIQKTYGEDVASAYAQGLVAAGIIAKNAEALSLFTSGQMDTLDQFVKDTLIELTEKDIISAPEIIMMRDGEDTANDRLVRDFGALAGDIEDVKLDLDNRGVNIKTLGVLGDGVTEETSKLQQILNNHRHIYIPEGSYLIDIEVGLEIPDNTIIYMDEGARFITTSTHLGSYKIIKIENKENIIFPNGLTIVGDGENHTGTTGEWGHGLVINSSRNIHFYNDVNVSGCWGDGVYWGSNLLVNNENIHFHGDVNVTDCGRQAVSVISAVNSTMNTVRAKNIRRTPPAAALDIEPNNHGEHVDNFSVRMVIAENCAIGVTTHILNDKTNFSVDKIVIIKNVDRAFLVTRNPNGYWFDHGVISVGKIIILESGIKPPLIFTNLSYDGSPSVRIGSVEIDVYGTATTDNELVSFQITSGNNSQTIFGNLDIGSITVKNNKSGVPLTPIRIINSIGVQIRLYNLWLRHVSVEKGSFSYYPTVSGDVSFGSSNNFKLQNSQALQTITNVPSELEKMPPKSMESFEYNGDRGQNVGLPTSGQGVVTLIRGVFGPAVIQVISNTGKIYIYTYDFTTSTLSTIREI